MIGGELRKLLGLRAAWIALALGVLPAPILAALNVRTVRTDDRGFQKLGFVVGAASVPGGPAAVARRAGGHAEEGTA